MNPLDYALSFVRSPGGRRNAPRFCVESRTVIWEGRNKGSEEFHQCASCKSETIFVKQGLFVQDNHDYLPIFGTKNNVVFRRKAYLNPSYRTVYPKDEPWKVESRIVEATDARILGSDKDVHRATAQYLPIVGQVEIANDATGLRALIEFPVKTMNIDSEQGGYQVDTGPVAWPDLSKRNDRLADCLRLAFVVFNAPDFLEVVIEAPAAIGKAGEEGPMVHHYSHIERVAARNRLFCIGGTT